MKFLHAADIHFKARDPEPALQSLAKIAETAREREVDLIIVAGDLFDAPIRNSDADSMPRLLDACGALLDAAPVVSVQGTPSHDAPGCYEPIVRMGDGRWMHIAARNAGAPIILPAADVPVKPTLSWWTGDWRGVDASETKCIITGLPEPSRGWLSARGEAQGRAETGEAVVDGLRSILAGIGAATHGRTVPHLHVQHGEVRGATLASGQVLPPGGIAVGTEDLALTGADYIALGHIHKAQAVSDGACYAGSAYPVNWGERDEKMMNVVELGTVDKLDAVPYGHPARIKHVLDVDAPSSDVNLPDVRGADVWLVLTCDADHRFHDGFEKRWQDVITAEGANSVRVTLERAPRERVRVPEISGGSWISQVSKWGQATSTIISPAHCTIVLDLQAQAKKEGAIPRPRRWRIKSLRLRGAIGIWRGSGRDEISIDFEAFDPGVIAITGPNGAGKTTILENMTPWPSMLTRGGPLQQHFRLRDSVRELVLVDDEAGDAYRCLIQIDSQSGRREQRVMRSVGARTVSSDDPRGTKWTAWDPLGADGSTAEYELVVDKLWGPRPLHMLSVVSPQKPVSIRVKGDDGEAVTVTTDLATASRGMKRALLRQLLGLGAYQAASRSAAERAGEHEQADRESLRTAGHYDDAAEFVGEAQTNVNAIGEYVGGRVAELATAEQTLEKRRAELEAVAKAAAASREARARATAIDDGIKQHIREKDRLNEKIAAHGGLPEYTAEGRQAQIDNHEADDRRLVELHAAASEADAARQTERERIGDQITDVVVERHQHEHRLARASDDIKVLGENVAEMDRTPLTCVECGQPLPEEALINTSKRRAQWVQQTNAAKLHENEASGLVVLCMERERELRAELPERPTPPDELMALRASAADRREALAKARTDLQRAQEWATKRQALEDERARLALRIAAAEQELIKAEWGVNMETEAEERAQRLYVERAVQALADAGAAVKTAEAEARRAREDLERCQAAATKRTELLDAAKGHEQKADAHRLVSTALGADGVQSLLLEHAAPRIAEIATDLLEQSYGARWRVRIELQRTGGQGSKRKVIEDVRFIVRDSESSESFGDDLDPGEQLLETLSGGESVWIKAALSEAIGRVRQERMNVSWRTALRDEADAGLDEGAAASYWRLVEAAHAMSGRHHTVAITHSGAQHAFQQRIEMGGSS